MDLFMVKLMKWINTHRSECQLLGTRGDEAGEEMFCDTISKQIVATFAHTEQRYLCTDIPQLCAFNFPHGRGEEDTIINVSVSAVDGGGAVWVRAGFRRGWSTPNAFTYSAANLDQMSSHRSRTSPHASLISVEGVLLISTKHGLNKTWRSLSM